jgi:hypothetical protein
MLFLAEFYLSASASLADVVARVRRAAQDVAPGGRDVTLLHAVFLSSDETCFALFQAASAADVTAAGHAAGLELDRVTAATAAF